MSTTFRERRGAHRPQGLGPAAAIPWLLAAVAIAAVVLFASGWLGGSSDAGEGPTASGDPPASTPSQSKTTKPAASTTKSVPPTTPTGGSVDRTTSVAVLNSTTRAGLASGAASRLRDDGWQIRSTGNYRSPLATTTVFYGKASLQATAQAVADALGSTTVEESADFGATRVTVVLGADYQ